MRDVDRFTPAGRYLRHLVRAEQPPAPEAGDAVTNPPPADTAAEPSGGNCTRDTFGGTSGTEWQVPGGHRMVFSGKPTRMLESRRRVLMPEIRRLADLPGIEVEDKNWSVALHTRHAPQDSSHDLDQRLAAWRPGARVRVFRGPEVHEIQLMPRVSKSFGVRMLCRFTKFIPGPGTLFYAGDDENDALAMRLVTRLGGTAVTVGERALIPASTVVKDQRELAKEVCRLADTAMGTLHHGNVSSLKE